MLWIKSVSGFRSSKKLKFYALAAKCFKIEDTYYSLDIQGIPRPYLLSPINHTLLCRTAHFQPSWGRNTRAKFIYFGFWLNLWWKHWVFNSKKIQMALMFLPHKVKTPQIDIFCENWWSLFCVHHFWLSITPLLDPSSQVSLNKANNYRRFARNESSWITIFGKIPQNDCQLNRWD